MAKGLQILKDTKLRWNFTLKFFIVGILLSWFMKLIKDYFL